MMSKIKQLAPIVFAIAATSLSTNTFAVSDVNDQLDDGIDLYDDQRYKNSAETLQKLVVAREFRKLDATEKALAITYLMYSLMDQDKPVAAMRYADRLVDVAAAGFGRTSEQYVDALLTKAGAQYRSGKDRDAVRSVQKTITVLERMGDEYSSVLTDVQSIPRQIRQKTWDKENLLKDLSDFYTQCETIKEGDALTKVSRVMQKYALIGKDYKPSGREKRRFKETYIKKARERSEDRANRLIYIPDEDHLDDWCVVYPNAPNVDRAYLVPPKD